MVLLSGCLLVGVAEATPQFQVGRYVDNTWYQAQTLTDLSGPVQFRCVLSWSDPVPTRVVFAVVPSIPGGEVLLSDATEGFAEGQTTVFMSAPFSTPLRCDQGYQAMATVVIPDGAPPPPQPLPPPPPPGGDPPGGGTPPIGTDWGAGAYPPADPGGNDIHLSPVEFTAKNLSVDDLWVIAGGPVAQFGPFVGIAGPEAEVADVEWRALLADGEELPQGAYVDLSVDLSAFHAKQSTDLLKFEGTVGPAPVEMGGSWWDVPPGVYTLTASADEQGTGDGDVYLSSRLSMSGPQLTWQLTAPRAGVITACFTVSGPDSPTDPLWVHKAEGEYTLHKLSGQPEAVLGENTAWIPVPDEVPLIVAGRHVVGFTYKDEGGPAHHSQEPKWADPEGFGIDVPGSVHFAGTYWTHTEGEVGAFQGDAAGAWSQLGKVIGQQLPHGAYPPGEPCWSFYGAFPPGAYGARGGVVSGPSKECFIDACRANTIVSFSGHGDADGIMLAPSIELTADDLYPLLHPELGGSMTGVKLAVLSACLSLGGPGPTDGVSQSLRLCGVRSVVGYDGLPDISTASFLDARLWYHLAKDGMTVADAVWWARWDWSQTYPSEDPVTRGVTTYKAEGDTSVAIVAPF